MPRQVVFTTQSFKESADRRLTMVGARTFDPLGTLGHRGSELAVLG